MGYVLVCVCIVANELGGYTYPWGSAQVISTLVVGLVMIGLFCVWQQFARYPMIPGYVFRNAVSHFQLMTRLISTAY